MADGNGRQQHHESTGDLYVGEGGQTGTMNWNGSGTLEVQGHLRIGQGGTGTFNQTVGHRNRQQRRRPHRRRNGQRRHLQHQRRHTRHIHGGTDPLQIASTEATGTLRVSGSAIVTHGAEMTIADTANSGSIGRLELLGSHATFRVAS